MTRNTSSSAKLSSSSNTSGDVPVAASVPSINSAGEFTEVHQLAGITAALLGLRCWDQASRILEMLKNHEIHYMRYPCIRMSLLSLISWRLDHLFATLDISKLCLTKPKTDNRGGVLSTSESIYCTAGLAGRVAGTVSAGQCSRFQSLDNLVEELSPLLQWVGHYLHSCPSLFSRICRLLRAHIELKTSKVSPKEMDWQPIMNIVTSILLPSLSSGPSSFFLNSQVWHLLSVVPFQIRFAAYDVWKGAGMAKEGLGNKPSEMVEMETKQLHEAKGQLKRLSKENIKIIGRQLGACTHNCPLPVLNHMLTQIESFDNLIPVIVEALRSLSPLSLDSLAFLLVNQLQKDDAKLKPGDTHYSQWFSSLSRFIALFYRRYYTVELHGLLHFLLRRFSKGESLDLLVLKELLWKMGGCDTLIQVS